MSYVVLARKYRPSTFSALVGQEPVVRTLRNAMAMNRVHHAFLLTGARGVGKTTTARLLARALNCDAGPTISPCGTCAHCVSMTQGNAPDVIEIDGASNTGVDNVRELREAVRYMPSVGRFKLYIIDEVHMLSQAAFNALLKTLEEPPPHIKFIFATTEPHKIPTTILSRCQRFDLRRVNLAVLTAHLADICRQENLTASDAALTTIAQEAQGSVRDALSLLDQVLSYAGDRPVDDVVLEALGTIDRQVIFALVDGIIARDATAVLSTVDAIANRGHDLGEVMALVVGHLRDVAVAAAIDAPDAALPERSADEVVQLQKQAQGRSQVDWHRLFAKACEVAEDVLQAAMPKITLEMGLLRLLQIAPAADLNDLLERLDQLMTTSPPTNPGAGPQGREPQNLPRSAVGVAPKPPALVADQPQGTPPQAKAQPDAPQVETVDEGIGGLGWRHFVDKVRRRRPDLSSVLEQGQLLAFGPMGVEVGYTPGTFFWEAAQDKENKALFGQWLAEHMGQADVPFKVVQTQKNALPGVMPSLAVQREQEQQDSWSQTQKEAREHENVRAAMQIFGGEVRSIRPATEGEG